MRIESSTAANSAWAAAGWSDPALVLMTTTVAVDVEDPQGFDLPL